MATSDSITPTKTCTGPCGRTLPATTEYFCRQKLGKYGVTSQCWDCEHARKAIYRASHKKEIATYHIEYNSRHKKESRENQQKRLATPKGKAQHCLASHRRRARIKGNGGTYTLPELDTVLKAHTNKKGQIICAFCGKPIKGKYEIDHFIPISRGGTNDAGNLRIMHISCNRKKHAKLPQELGRLI